MPIPADYAATRDIMHRVATHVLARRRFAVAGRFGLRPTPGGFGTPAFGEPGREEVVRVAGGLLVREQRDGDTARTTVRHIAGSSLAELAASADVDLSAPLSVGRDTVDPGPIDQPLDVDLDAAATMADWLHWGAQAIDRVLGASGADARPSIAQLWPEHFDLGLDVAVARSRANLGASLGDRFHALPYVYVGPWEPDRPGDPEFWNVDFGALRGYDEVASADDPVTGMVVFFQRGLALLR